MNEDRTTTAGCVQGQREDRQLRVTYTTACFDRIAIGPFLEDNLIIFEQSIAMHNPGCHGIQLSQLCCLWTLRARQRASMSNK